MSRRKIKLKSKGGRKSSKIKTKSTKPEKLKKKKKWKLIRQVPKKRKKKLDDDDILNENGLEDSEGVVSDTETSENEDAEVIEEVEVVNDSSDTLESMEDSESFSLGGSGEDSQLQIVRSNPKPRQSWADRSAQFSPGDLVVPIELNRKEALEYEPYKIICYHIEKESYSAKKSGSNNETVLYADEIKLAPKKGKPFVNYWEKNNPFNIPGVNISCPSNNKK